MENSLFIKLVARSGYLLMRSSFKLPTEGIIRIFVEKAYLRDLLKRLKINCIFDVGANEGQYARMLRKLGYRGYIFSFEPNPAGFAILSKHFENDRFWKGFNFALGSEDGRKPINIAEESCLSSFLALKKHVVSGAIQVDVKRLDSIFDVLVDSIANPSVLLKMDTQGYDLEVIKGAKQCIDRVVALQSEISVEPIYEDIPHYLEALSYYESLGYKLMDLSIVNRARHGGIVEYDCLMARVDEIKNSK